MPIRSEGVINSNDFPERLKRYLAIIKERDQKILACLKMPTSLDDLQMAMRLPPLISKKDFAAMCLHFFVLTTTALSENSAGFWAVSGETSLILMLLVLMPISRGLVFTAKTAPSCLRFNSPSSETLA